MANPRKFSEKIALQKQKQAEGTAEFERIMKEVYATKRDETQPNQNITDYGLAGTETNASVGGGASPGAGNGSGGGASPDGVAGSGGGGGSPTAYRESRGRSVVGVGPMRRPSERKQDRSPYGSSAATGAGALVNALGLPNSGPNTGNNGNNNNGTQTNLYLSPPMDTNWRRSNSDSALHQSLNMAVAAENAVGGNFNTDMNHTLHANYPQQQQQQQQQHHHQQQQQQQHGQRSHSPHHIARSFSPQAQRRKPPLLPHQLQLQQLQQQQQNMQQQLHLQQQLQHQQQHQQHQQHQQQQQQHQQQQQPMPYNPKFANSLFRPLQEQANFANTGSLPNLTALQHYAPAQQQQQQQQQQPPQQQQQHAQQLQQQTLSPVMSPHNQRRERDQSPSPFSPAGGGPASPYHQPQHSPTSSANTSFSPLPTLGANNASNVVGGNLTDYRQPAHPSSPRSSPGLLSSVSGSELHTSAPASPIRVQQLPSSGSSNNFDGTYNSLNPSFHNHFENFSLGDSNSSPEQQQSFPNNFVALDFEDMGSATVNGVNGPYQQQQQQQQDKLLDFNELSGSPDSSLNNNNQLRRSNNQQQQQQQQQQQLLNNNSNGSATHNGGNNMNGPRSESHHNNNRGGAVEPLAASPIPSPLGGASSPLPIPMSAQASPQQLSLSLHHSPHHSPLHSPHHSNSPLSSSSPVSNACNSNMLMNHQQQQHHHQHQSHHQQQQSHTPTTANIPAIVFSDYSCTADFNKEIFDTLDLDLGQMDVAGLQMLSDQNPIMIADPTIEDSFRRDLN